MEFRKNLASAVADIERVKPAYVREAEEKGLAPVEKTMQELVGQIEPLQQGVPQAENLNAYGERVISIQNWVGMYRQALRDRMNQRGAINNRLMAQTPEPQKELMGKLISLGQGDPESSTVTLGAIHDILVSAEPRFSVFSDLMDSGLIDPEMPLQPSQSSVPDQLSEPASSIEHIRST
jgi:hypothetical protein